MTKQIIAICVCVFGVATSRADIVFFEQNASLNPVNIAYDTSVTEVGFAFTPTSTVELSGFRTKFSSSDPRTVTFQLFSAIAGVPNTAIALVNQSFAPLGGGVLTGADFSPFTLIGGMEYFAAVTNVGGLGVNFTNDDGAVAAPNGQVRYTQGGPRFGGFIDSPPQNQPIFQFLTPAPVPEPSTTVLLALCGAVGGGISLRRRRAAVK